MKLKWCILLAVIAMVGIVSQQQVCLPNQEIVLRFTNGAVTSDEAQNVIALVKTQLQAIGANNIHVKESKKGDLKIVYYSDTDVISIKKLLSKEKDVALDYTSTHHAKRHSKIPAKKNIKSYDIDVFEIKKQDTGFEGGKYATQLKSENTRFFISNLLTLFNDVDFGNSESVLKQTYKFRKNSAIAIDITSNRIPDGRAGPFRTQNQINS